MFSRRSAARIHPGVRGFAHVHLFRPVSRPYMHVLVAVLLPEIVYIGVTHEYPPGFGELWIPRRCTVLRGFMESCAPTPEHCACIIYEFADLSANLRVPLIITEMSVQCLLDFGGVDHQFPGLDLGAVSQFDSRGTAITHDYAVDLGTYAEFPPVFTEVPLESVRDVVHTPFSHAYLCKAEGDQHAKNGDFWRGGVVGQGRNDGVPL